MHGSQYIYFIERASLYPPLPAGGTKLNSKTNAARPENNKLWPCGLQPSLFSYLSKPLNRRSAHNAAPQSPVGSPLGETIPLEVRSEAEQCQVPEIAERSKAKRSVW